MLIKLRERLLIVREALGRQNKLTMDIIVKTDELWNEGKLKDSHVTELEKLLKN